MNHEIKELYLKVLTSLEVQGWKKEWIANDGFAVYSRALGDEEFVLHIDQNSVVVRDENTLMLYYESPAIKDLKQSIESLLTWKMLQKSIKELEEVSSQ